MRGDHFSARFTPVWGCGEHTKVPIMAPQAPTLLSRLPMMPAMTN
jgi:hypothetical protein